jgi:hypothetical protein
MGHPPLLRPQLFFPEPTALPPLAADLHHRARRRWVKVATRRRETLTHRKAVRGTLAQRGEPRCGRDQALPPGRPRPSFGSTRPTFTRESPGGLSTPAPVTFTRESPCPASSLISLLPGACFLRDIFPLGLGYHSGPSLIP